MPPKSCMGTPGSNRPRFVGGVFRKGVQGGSSMLEMSKGECFSLQIISLKCQVKAERHGSAHQLNWKKTGLSVAWFKRELVTSRVAADDANQGGLRVPCILSR